MIEIKDVMKSFENKNVLNHLNVTISSGSIFGLIGPNGAGKSTLLYLLDEPEVSLSPANQVALAQEINELTHYLGCQFIIATHSPFMLGTLNAKIYNLDAREYEVTPWYKLENVRYFYDFFKKHEKEFND